MQWGERRLNRILRDLESGADLREVMERTDFGEVRDRVSEAIARLEQARHEVKVATFLLAHEEGMSIGYLSQRWGISRQRGHMYAQETG